jgi:molybdenum cofactor cytidylyltransferase
MVCALVLAAGRSRRMGTQKLLLPLGGQPVIAHVVDQVLASPVDQTLVVLGPDGDRISQALRGRRVSFVTNALAEAEMLDSLRCGLRALPATCQAVLVVLGDQPGVRAELIGALLQALDSSPRRLVLPVHAGRRGHPVLFTVSYRQELLDCHQGVGLRGLLQAHAAEVVEVSVAQPLALADMDLPSDYQKLAALWGHI